MAERGLLHALPPAARARSRPGDAVSAIAEHLRGLLNTRKGEAAAAPGFGIMDFNDLVHRLPGGHPDGCSSPSARAIQEYEPRLKNVIVLHVPDEQDPRRFGSTIIAQLATRDARGTVRFQTQ